MKYFLFFAVVLAANVFSADWYARGKGHEKCMNLEDGIQICREIFTNNDTYCYGKERVWIWPERRLVSVRNLNHKCEHHGWAKFLMSDGKWVWKCYLNNREMEDSACKGFSKR
jgi:hypothetical protein